MTKSDLVEILESKKIAVLSEKIPNRIGNDLRKISTFSFSMRGYLYFASDILRIPLLCDFGKCLDQNYPYIVWLEDFVKNTTHSETKYQFHGFDGFIFRTGRGRIININPQKDLFGYVCEAKIMLKRLHGEIVHYLKTIGSEDLNNIPPRPNNILLQEKDDVIVVDPDIKKLSFHGERLHQLTAKKFPAQLFGLAFGNGKNRYEIPLREIVALGYKYPDIIEGIDNFQKILSRKLKTRPDACKIVDNYLLRKPSDTIEISEIFVKGVI